MISARLTNEIIRTASKVGLALHREHGRIPTLDRLVWAVLTSGEPWIEELDSERNDRYDQIATVIRDYLEANGCTTELKRPQRRKRR
jgi:hypothetical protein